MSQEEWDHLRFQFGTLNEKASRGQHRKYLPLVFTEQGVAMLSAVLTTERAITTCIQIIQAFVTMRKLLQNNASIFQRLNQVEINQLKTDEKIELIFKALAIEKTPTKQGFFYDGQIFDAYVFVADLIKNAQSSIILIDIYIDETVLILLAKRPTNVTSTLYTKTISKQLQLDLQKHNSQYPEIKIIPFNHAYDRFIILDEKVLYHIGASLKDLEKMVCFLQNGNASTCNFKKTSLISSNIKIYYIANRQNP